MILLESVLSLKKKNLNKEKSKPSQYDRFYSKITHFKGCALILRAIKTVVRIFYRHIHLETSYIYRYLFFKS